MTAAAPLRPDAPSRASTRLPLVGLAVGQILAWSALFYSFPALLPAWSSEGWPPGAASAGLTLALLVAAAAAPAAGRGVDRGRGPAMMGLGAILGGAAVALAALAPPGAGWAWFLGCWALTGLGMAGCLYEPCFALIVRARPATARRDITRLTLIAGFATLLAFPLWTALSGAVGWRGALLGCGAMSACAAAPLLYLSGRALERTAPRGAAPRPPPLPRRRKRRRFAAGPARSRSSASACPPSPCSTGCC